MKTKMQKYEWRATAPNIQTFKVLKTLKVYNSPVRLFDCSVVRLFVLLLGCFLCQLPTANCSAQSDGVRIPSDQLSKVDSLLLLLKKDKPDTSKINHLNELAWAYHNISNYDTLFIYGNQALVLSQKIKFKKGEANALHNIGEFYYHQGNYPDALKNFFAALKIREETKDKSGIAKSFGIIGIVYSNQADYPKALDYYFRALKMKEELNDKSEIAKTLGNIGNVYSFQADYPKALDYYFRTLKMDEGLGNKSGIAIQLGNIGLVYWNQADYPKALDYYFRALKMDEELGNKNGIDAVLGNIGLVYYSQADYPKVHPVERDSLLNKALDYYFRALKMSEELGDKDGIAINLGNIGSLYTKTGKFKEAEDYLKHSLALCDSIKALDITRGFERSLSQLYDTTGRTKLALEHYKKYIAARDTINSDENQKKQTRTEMNFEFEKKEAATKAEQEKKDAVAQAEARKQNIILLFVVSGLLLVVAFAAFILRAYTQIKKKNIEISEQKRIIEAKQEEILASIRYAARIQKCMMPTEKWIAKEIARLKAKMPK